MNVTENSHIQFMPQSIILISGSPSRKQALKALLRAAFKDIAISVSEDYPGALRILSGGASSNSLVVMDNFSVSENPEKGCKFLKEFAPGIHCLMLVQPENRPGKRDLSSADAVLEGNFSGGQFVETIQKLIDQV